MNLWLDIFVALWIRIEPATFGPPGKRVTTVTPISHLGYRAYIFVALWIRIEPATFGLPGKRVTTVKPISHLGKKSATSAKTISLGHLQLKP